MTAENESSPFEYFSKELKELGARIEHVGNNFIANFRGYKLFSAFQPIFSLSHKRVVGYEGLIRAFDNHHKEIPPADLFHFNDVDRSLVLLDRLCRCLHIQNFSGLEDNLNWLFLNISPQICTLGQGYGSFFKDLLNASHFSPNRVVVEIVEYPITNNRHLEETINYYKDIGCLIAIDDFGSGHSNFERIWSLNPEIVKLDRSMIQNATNHPKIRRLLPEIVTLLHQAGSLVLIEGIETREQVMIAMESDVDFVQGFFFGRPSSDHETIRHTIPDFDTLFLDFKETHSEFKEQMASLSYQYDSLIQLAAEQIRQGHAFDRACRQLIADKASIRCYLLQPDGIQIGRTIVAQHYCDTEDLRYKPIQNAESADWFRRHYLINAVSHPGQLQITQPYLSITGIHMCITLSMMFECKEGNRVLCCDLNWI